MRPGPDVETLERAADALDAADAILVGAGAGMGVDSGLPDFRGTEGFWRAYPPFARLGLRFEELANPQWFDRDPDCILDEDGGTKAEIISQNADSPGSAAKSIEEPIEQVTARALGNYHAAAQQDWDERWSGVIGEQ